MAEQRLIDAKALSDALYEADAITMKGVVIINQFPTVEAKPVVHAHWLKRDIDHMWTRCSACGNNSHYASNYCPHCGAQMD